MIETDKPIRVRSSRFSVLIADAAATAAAILLFIVGGLFLLGLAARLIFSGLHLGWRFAIWLGL